MRRLAIIVLILSFGAIAWGQDAEGSAIFNAYCRPCHGVGGDGKTPASQKMLIPDLRSAEVQKLADDDLYERIGNGAKHKQYPHSFLKKGMSDTQLRQVIEHIHSFKARN